MRIIGTTERDEDDEVSYAVVLEEPARVCVWVGERMKEIERENERE